MFLLKCFSDQKKRPVYFSFLRKIPDHNFCAVWAESECQGNPLIQRQFPQRLRMAVSKKGQGCNVAFVWNNQPRVFSCTEWYTKVESTSWSPRMHAKLWVSIGIMFWRAARSTSSTIRIAYRITPQRSTRASIKNLVPSGIWGGRDWNQDLVQPWNKHQIAFLWSGLPEVRLVVDVGSRCISAGCRPGPIVWTWGDISKSSDRWAIALYWKHVEACPINGVST